MTAATSLYAHLPAVAVDAPVDLANVLHGMAWLGVVAPSHVQQLWLPHRGIRRARVLLRHLEHQGLVDAYHWFVPRRRGGRHPHTGGPWNTPPRDAGYWWFLTRRGLDLASTLVGDELTTVGLRAPQVLAHDHLVVDTIVHLIERARRAGLSGVYVEREALLNPPARKPRMDAVVVLRTQPRPASTVYGVPWTLSHALPEDTSHRFALEIDNGTEDDATLTAKALTYAEVATSAWATKHRAFPLPVWVVGHGGDARRDRIHRLWQRAWPDGQWLLATDADVHADRWQLYRAGTLRAHQLFPPDAAVAPASDGTYGG